MAVAGSINIPSAGRAHPAPVRPMRLAAGDGATNAAAQSRALVPITPPRPHTAAMASRRPSAAFLAQLIATAQQAPQTRARRRAEPAHVNAVYTEASAVRTAGPALRRSL
jgi:hypothetical protein